MVRRSMMVFVSGVVVAAGVPAAAPASAPSPSSNRIVIGRSIGGVAVGQTFTQAKAAWGPGSVCPEPPIPPPPGERRRTFCTWTAGTDGELGDATFEGARTVENIEISAPAAGPSGLPPTSPLTALRTTRGVRLGSSSAAVRRAYPRALRKVLTGFAFPYIDYVITGPGRLKTTFAVQGAAQRVRTIRIGN